MNPAEAKAIMDGAAASNPAAPNGAESKASQPPIKRRKKSQGKDSVADKLLELAIENSDLWQDTDGNAYATVRVGHCDTNLRVQSKKFSSFISKQLYAKYKQIAGPTLMSSVLALLEQEAFQGKSYKPAVRIAEHEGAIYIDLCNAMGEKVRVDQEGWKTTTECPVKFLRPKSAKPLPNPVKVRGPEPLSRLLDLFNLEPPQKVLVIGWLVSSWRPQGPYFLLIVTGQQGSAKTTLCRGVKSMLDPAAADRRSLPTNEWALYIAASNNLVLAFDNISSFQQWLSDALCRLSTGGGFSTRKLYENDEENIFEASRPVVANGIEEFATRPDLLERALILDLKRILDSQRLTEQEFWAKFDALLPEALGALLDAVSIALRNVGSVKLPSKPRMIDAAAFITAAEPALGWAHGTFMAAYEQNADQAVLIGLESSPVALLVMELITEGNSFSGTPTELLNSVRGLATERNILWKDLPPTASKLSGTLKRLAPALLEVGIEFSQPRRSKERLITLRRATGGPSDSLPKTPGYGIAKRPPTTVHTGSVASVGSDGQNGCFNSDCEACVAQGTICVSCDLLR